MVLPQSNVLFSLEGQGKNQYIHFQWRIQDSPEGIANSQSVTYYYRPQRSWGKVMFSQACVILFTGGGVWKQTSPQEADTPLEADIPPKKQTPPRSRHPREADTPPKSRPPWKQTPPKKQTPPFPWEIRSTRGRYASYWNAMILSGDL